LDACLNGDGGLFQQIKLLRKSGQVVSTHMDGIKDDIPGHVKNIYSKLYNTHNDVEEMSCLENETHGKVNPSHLSDVKKVTPDIVKEADKHLNNSNSDNIYSFSSDCIKNSPDVQTSVRSSSVFSNSWSCYSISPFSNLGPYHQR
jgi:hypothetical protein